VPTDFSPESLSAVAFATSLARAHQARLYLLHVTRGDDAPVTSLKTALHNMTASETDLPFATKVFVEAGIPSRKILDLADELAVDLIVLGVKAPSLLKGTSTHQAMATACNVVSAAVCPVITVRQSAQL